MASGLASSKPSSSQCYASGAYRPQIDIVIKNATALPQDGQWIEVVYKWCMHLCHEEKLIMYMNGKTCQRRQIGGCTSMARSSSTSCVGARSSNTWTPMCTSNRCRPSGGQSCLSLCWQSTRSTRPLSSCRTDRSSSSHRRSSSGSSRTYWLVCQGHHQDRWQRQGHWKQVLH